MAKSKSQINVEVFSEIPHADISDEHFFQHVQKLSRKDFRVGTGIEGIDWTGKIVLEFGCGSGLKLLPMGLRGAKIIGVDGSANQIDRISKYAKMLKLSECEFIHCYLEDVDKKLKEFSKIDLIICSGVIHHVQEWCKIIKFFSEYLKPGGWLYLTWTDWTLYMSRFNIKNQIAYRLGWDVVSRMKIGTFLFGWWDKRRNKLNIPDESFFADLYSAYYIPISYRKMAKELQKNNFSIMGIFPYYDIRRWLKIKRDTGSLNKKAFIVQELIKFKLLEVLLNIAIRMKNYLSVRQGARVVTARKN
ncbi:MAG: hypothetical protein A3F41_04470 [Coxiella sp. RIFCSPHIGHO2_12_FULL_44_14]|nr:MAG: hypothetical protein A3F41_04470 [Coxiella sp. RIFCSPHIGHO2_12_FULL_44_14]